jgi:hypothetical protein
MEKKKPWATSLERDIMLDEDIRESGLQGGKVIADKLALFSFILGIPLLITGLFGLINMLLGLGFPTNTAVIILVMLVIAIGSLLTLGGYFIYKGN